MPVVGSPIPPSTSWCVRSDVEQKVGADNLSSYADLNNDGNTTTIGNAIADDITEAATDMAVSWREFTSTALGYSNAIEQRWLLDTNAYGAAVKAWAGRNVEAGRTDAVPQQIATALSEWERRLGMLRDGTALKDYQDEQNIGGSGDWEADEPVSVLPTVDQEGRTISDPPPKGFFYDRNAPGYRWQ